jgi:toxin ParE1/3/4
MSPAIPLRYAVLLAERLIAAVEQIGQFPESGRVVPEIGEETLRDIVHGNYRIVYRLGSEAVEIIAVHHGARLFRL